MARSALQKQCMTWSVVSMFAGVGGMVLSFIYLASASMADITAGTSGFVAGAILFGAGLLSISTIAAASDDEDRA